MVDNSWVLGIIMTACFGGCILALTVKLISYMFSKDKKVEQKEED